MEQTDLLEGLLHDPEKLQSALSMATSLLGGNTAESAPPAAPSNTGLPIAANGMPDPDDPSYALMQRAMPVLAAITQSGQKAVSPEKRALLNAVKPFVSDPVRMQIDHGVRLVSMARMARSALHQLQNGTAEGGSTRV